MLLNIYFDKAKEILHLPSDAALARHLGIVPQELNRARKDGLCSNRVLRTLAEINEVPYPAVFIAREADKLKNRDVKEIWTEAHRISTQAAA